MLRIMTFNLRFENDRDGENAWVKRRRWVIELVESYRPDILGTQEGLWSQLTYLGERLGEYRLHAPNRVLDDTCQYPTLFYRFSRFRLIGGEEFWLSMTPHVHRSKGWDSAFPRMMSSARLEDLEGGSILSVAVTHLDHVGAEARVHQAGILAEWVKRQAPPVLLMGDFNDEPESAAHRLLTAAGTGLRDTWEELGQPEGASSYTHHGFSGIPQKERIDWVLASRPLRPVSACIVRDRFGEDGRYPSDHFPYCVDLENEKAAEG